MKSTIETDMNTVKLQAKLKAISHHAEALAEELEVINKAKLCGQCSSFMEEVNAYANNDVIVETGYRCPECNEHQST